MPVNDARYEIAITVHDYLTGQQASRLLTIYLTGDDARIACPDDHVLDGRLLDHSTLSGLLLPLLCSDRTRSVS